MSGWQRAVEERARARLSPALLEYLTQGSREGVTAAEAGWTDVRFAPHVLRDVTDIDLGTTLLGGRRSAPWAVAPTTLQRAVHPEGELAMARACADEDVLMVVSSNAGTPFEAIGETGVAWWVQVYLPADRTLAVPMLERATLAGARGVVLTVDTPVVAAKYSAGASVWDEVDDGLVRVNFDAGYDAQPGSEKALDLGPHDLGWLESQTGLPVVVKGVLRPDDARRCVEAGAAAVWVSNHGGRQLDRAVSARQALPAIATAVGEQAQVYADGGIRSGLDVLAGLALGADAVFLGRLPLLALADGQPGVAGVLRHLRDEVEEAFRLAGCRAPADTRGIVAPTPRIGL